VTERIIMAGSGGQGMMLIGKIVATAAMEQGLETTFFPSYGAEVRGGTAHCHVVVSDAPIHSPIVESADALVLMNQPSYEKFRPRLREGGLLLLNTSMARLSESLERSNRVLRLEVPATAMADSLGNVRVANVVMLGAYMGARALLSPDVVFRELERELSGAKASLLEVNRMAFRRGLDLALANRP